MNDKLQAAHDKLQDADVEIVSGEGSNQLLRLSASGLFRLRLGRYS